MSSLRPLDGLDDMRRLTLSRALNSREPTRLGATADFERLLGHLRLLSDTVIQKGLAETSGRCRPEAGRSGVIHQNGPCTLAVAACMHSIAGLRISLPWTEDVPFSRRRGWKVMFRHGQTLLCIEVSVDATRQLCAYLGVNQ